MFILAVLTSLVHYQNHKNVLCKSYLSHKGLMHWKQADLCCLKKKWIHRYTYSSNSVALFCCCDAHLLNMLKITIIILIKLFCLISKYRIFTFTNFVWLLGARVKTSQSKWIERERKQIPHCPANKPIVKQRIISYSGQLAKWYK